MVKKATSSTVFFLFLYCLGYSQTTPGLTIPLEGISEVKLILKDEFSGSEIESYLLDANKIPAFIKDMNAMKPAPQLRMMVSCYKYVIAYTDGRKIEITTNGKGVVNTPVGNFLAAENLITKHWLFSKEQFCQPKDPSKKKPESFGF